MAHLEQLESLDDDILTLAILELPEGAYGEDIFIFGSMGGAVKTENGGVYAFNTNPSVYVSESLRFAEHVHHPRRAGYNKVPQAISQRKKFESQ
jgi:hypothetical protein